MTRSTLTDGPSSISYRVTVGDLRVDAELVEHGREPVDHGVGRLARRLVQRAGLQRVGRRQEVGDVAGQRQLLHDGGVRGQRVGHADIVTVLRDAQ